MPIPKALPTGLLPPFLKSPAGGRAMSAFVALPGGGVTRDGISPWIATMGELVERFATSPHRRRLVDGLLGYRAELRRVGLRDGFQWIDGSFVETQGREPADVDVVTISSLPASSDPADEHLFDPREARRRFLCDAYFVDLGGSPVQAVIDAVYWYGLFSHQRASERWKGLVQVDLSPPDGDGAARERLRQIVEEKGAS